MSEERQASDIAALAKGGRTNFIGFLLRLVARMPFLFISGRLYGAEALGRFAFALVVVELAAQLCTLGQKRGLAQRLAAESAHPANDVADALMLGGVLAVTVSLVLYAFPQAIFPGGNITALDRLVVLSIMPSTLTEIALAALAYRFDIKATVRARAVVEPWTLSAMAGLFYVIDKYALLGPDKDPGVYDAKASGLLIAFTLSIIAAALAALWPLFKSYGTPKNWRPNPRRIGSIAIANLPLAVADAVEWGTRRFDIFILRFFAGDAAVGIYYVAQQIASLPQKLKTSFEPILGPVIARNLRDKNFAAIAKQVCQVGFWITAMQAGIALAIGITGEGWMGLVGPRFVYGNGGLVFLLIAEVLAATAVVSEAALIYVARMQNLAVSLITLAVQAIATVGLMLLIDRLGYNDMYRAAMAGAGLMIALGTASLIKSRLLARILGQSINNWRWPLIWAAIPAALIGWASTRYLPEWAELAFGAPATLAIYGLIIWHWGFGPEDRMLFRKSALPELGPDADDED